jgi:hypothetical protein
MKYKTFILTDEGEKELVGLSTPPEIEEDKMKELKELFVFDNNISTSFSIKINGKKYGNIFEKHLYFKNHKKKRIRKKYSIEKLLNILKGSEE